MSNDVIDRLLLNAMLGLSAVGVYSMGYRLAAMGQVVAVSLNQAYGPVFIRTLTDADASRRAGDTATADAALRRIGRLGLLTVAGVSCVVLAITAVAREVRRSSPRPLRGLVEGGGPAAPASAWACCHFTVDLLQCGPGALDGDHGSPHYNIAPTCADSEIRIMGAASAALLSTGTGATACQFGRSAPILSARPVAGFALCAGGLAGPGSSTALRRSGAPAARWSGRRCRCVTLRCRGTDRGTGQFWARKDVQ
jgi:hypothetical protein